MKTTKNGTSLDTTLDTTPADGGASPAPDPSVPPPVVLLGPPSQHAPQPPQGWTKTKQSRARKAKAAQVDNAEPAAGELRRATSYAEDFGPKAPDPNVLANVLEGAAAWRGEWSAGRRWYQFTSEQRGGWEEQMLKQMGELQPLFDYAYARDPSIAKRYPGLTQFMNATKVIGRRSARTRKNDKAKAAKKETSPKPPSPAPTPTPAPTTSH